MRGRIGFSWVGNDLIDQPCELAVRRSGNQPHPIGLDAPGQEGRSPVEGNWRQGQCHLIECTGVEELPNQLSPADQPHIPVASRVPNRAAKTRKNAGVVNQTAIA